MARAAATWANSNADHWKAGLKASESINLYWLTEVLQPLEYLLQTHNHDGVTPGSGRVLPFTDHDSILYYGGA